MKEIKVLPFNTKNNRGSRKNLDEVQKEAIGKSA